MSITNRHAIVPFIAGTTVPYSDQRLAKIGYKSTKKTVAKYKSIAVSIPKLDGLELSDTQMERIVPHIVQMLENAQDGIIRSLYESSEGKRTEVSDDDISIDSCISYMEAESNGGRLTKEYLEQWFDSGLRDNLTVVICDKMYPGIGEPNQDQLDTAGKHVNAYRALVSSLAGGKTMLNDVQCKGLIKALEVTSTDDETSKKLMTRLNGMLNKPKIEELLEL